MFLISLVHFLIIILTYNKQIIEIHKIIRDFNNKKIEQLNLAVVLVVDLNESQELNYKNT